MSRAPLAAAVFGVCVLVSAPVRAAEECVEFKGLGCYYIPPTVSPEKVTPLVVFHRGHYGDYKGKVPDSEVVKSARQIFHLSLMKYRADEWKFAALVTGSSDISVGPEDVAAVEERFGGKFQLIFVASHSGGHVGMSRTLDLLPRIDRIVMLDNFYFGIDLTKMIQAKIFGGTTCAGFYTPHNKERVDKRFMPFVQCALDELPAKLHTAGVARCLATYLKYDHCD